MTKRAKKTSSDRGRFKKKEIRPTAWDLAALEILSTKYNAPESQVWRQGLARLVDFEGVRDLVEAKATLLENGAVSSAG